MTGEGAGEMAINSPRKTKFCKRRNVRAVHNLAHFVIDTQKYDHGGKIAYHRTNRINANNWERRYDT